MSFPGIKNRSFSAVAILLLWSIMLRVIVYFLLPPAREMGQYESTAILFFSGLTDHFSDYIAHITLIPPATYIINASVFMALGIKQALHIRAFLILVSAMDIAAVMLLFNAAKKAGAGKRASFLMLSLFSAVLIPFELWKEGMFYDHHTVFFTAFFAWSLVTLIKTPDRYVNMLWVSIAGGFLVSQSAVNAAIVPFSIILILSFIYIPAKQFSKLALALLISFLLPAAILVSISKKNQAVGEEALTSNKAGPAMMMVVQRAYKYDANKVRSVAIECGAPEYYIWTYDHASFPTDKLTGNPDTLAYTLDQAFGICYYSEELVGKPGPFGFDFHPLLNHLRQNDSLASFTRLVEQDSADALYKPYRFAGYSQALSPRWIGIYGDISKKIYFKTLLKNPVGMLRSFAIQQGIFSIYGPLFPYNIMNTKTSLLVRAGLQTIPGKIPLKFFFSIVVLLFALIAWITYWTALVNILLRMIRWIRNRKTDLTESGRNYFLLVSIPVLLVAGVFSCLVGGENDRYFMQASPYIILLATLLPGLYKARHNKSIIS